jgi:hypothetical protein
MKEQVVVPDGVPKSGRSWKIKQTARSSAQMKKGVLSHLSKTFEERDVERQKRKMVKELEREMIEDRKRKKLEEKTRREEQQKRRQENEYKNSVVQEVRRCCVIALQYLLILHFTLIVCEQLKPEKLKGMSKKQLRSVRKTAVNKHGQVELVNPWGEGGAANKKTLKKSRK